MKKEDAYENLQLGAYRLIRKLGEGGMGCVWLAEHERLRSPYAMKLAFGDHGCVERQQLRTEAERMKELDERRIPYLVDYMEEEEYSALVMEYVDGVSLEEYIRQHAPFEETEAIGIMKRLCSIVAYLHGLRPQIIYRDIKPANFIVTDAGDIRLLDFGTALQNLGSLGSVSVCGTPGYAAPEQLAGGHCRADADVYALAAIYSYMLTGQNPAAPPYHALRGAACGRLVSRASQRLIDRCLSAEPDERLADAAALKAELRRIRPGREAVLWLLEGLLYTAALWGEIIAALALIYLRYKEHALPKQELWCAIAVLITLLWGLVRDLLYTGGSFILSRSWNLIYTEKKGVGLRRG